MKHWFTQLWQSRSANKKRQEARADLVASFTKDGTFLVLAFDHRGSFIKMMQEKATRHVEVGDAIILKSKIIAALAPLVSGVLIDEDYGLPAYREAKSSIPFLLPAEKTGYTDQKGERLTEIERSAEELKALGATGVKLLLYVNHLVPSWKQQMQIAREVIADAHEQDLPVFLEFVLYEPEGYGQTSVVACVEKAITEGVLPDVWKLPYPGSVEASEKITQLVGNTPWVLLTGGSTFDEFKNVYVQARQGGVAGFVAGRSLWQEAGALFEDAVQLNTFVNETLIERFETLKRL